MLKLFSAAMMLLAPAFTAVLTGGLINRLMGPRLVALFGPRSMRAAITLSSGSDRSGCVCV